MNAAPPPTIPSIAVSRRDLLARTGHLALLALSAGVPAFLSGCTISQGRQAQASDPELAQIVDTVIGVDMHSHAGGVHFRSKPVVNLAEQMRQGRMTAVCLGHSGDGPVIRRDADNRVITSRNPGPGELWRHTQGRLDLGSDVGGAPRNVWPDYADFPLVVQLLRQKGFSAEEIGKLVGGNYVRVFNASAKT